VVRVAWKREAGRERWASLTGVPHRSPRPPIRSYAAQGLGGATRGQRSETEAFVVFGFVPKCSGFVMPKMLRFVEPLASSSPAQPYNGRQTVAGGGAILRGLANKNTLPALIPRFPTFKGINPQDLALNSESLGEGNLPLAGMV